MLVQVQTSGQGQGQAGGQGGMTDFSGRIQRTLQNVGSTLQQSAGRISRELPHLPCYRADIYTVILCLLCGLGSKRLPNVASKSCTSLALPSKHMLVFACPHSCHAATACGITQAISTLCDCAESGDATSQKRAEARLNKDLKKIDNISSHHSKTG